MEKLYERTEGWAAGLRLAVLTLQNQSSAQDIDKVIQSFTGNHRYVADYLIGEVFSSQPREVQDFLLATCFLNHLTGSLCDAITGTDGGQKRLEQLERDNLFLNRLEHGNQQGWYRYYPLFAESIQSLARSRINEKGIQAIYEKASIWFEDQMLLDDAIETALAANLFERAVTLVEKFVEIYNLTELVTLTRWMERIPNELILRHPEICLAYAQVILFTTDRFAPATALRIEPFLQAAEDGWKSQGNEGKVGAVISLRGMMQIWQGDLRKALDNVALALEKLPEQDVYWRGISLLNSAYGELYNGRLANAQDRLLVGKALLGASQNVYGVLAANQMLGEIFYWQGDHEQSIQVCEQIINEAIGDESMIDDQGIAYLYLANNAYELNDLEKAGKHAEQASSCARQRANEMLDVNVAIRMAFIQAARGNVQQGQDQLKSLSTHLQNPAAQRTLLNGQASLSL